MNLLSTTIVIGALWASSASAAPYEVPYTMRAVHADLHSQLMTAGSEPGNVGSNARVAAELFKSQNDCEAFLVLPLTGAAGALVAQPRLTDGGLAARAQLFKAELPRLLDGSEKVIEVTVELYAAADLAGNAEVARLAERVIWHQANDMEVLYPGASLVSDVLVDSASVARPESVIASDCSTYGTSSIPMMGVGDSHTAK